MPKGYWGDNRNHGHCAGYAASEAYSRWHGMMRRCYETGHVSYPNYGAKQIGVDARWHDFKNFYKDMGDPPEGMWLERKNAQKNYGPSNCVWTTPKNQQRNRTNNNSLTYCGKTQTIAAWAEELGIPAKTLYSRHSRGWTDERILTQPVKPTSQDWRSAS